MNELLEQYLSEANELMEGITDNLIQLDRQPGDPRIMNELFRLVHTLKGNSGMLGFDLIASVLHASEDLMDALRNGAISPSPEFVDLLLGAMDFATRLHKEIEQSEEYSPGHAGESERLTSALRELLHRKGEAAPSVPEAPAAGESAEGEGSGAPACACESVAHRVSPEARDALRQVLGAQKVALASGVEGDALKRLLVRAEAVLSNCCRAVDDVESLAELEVLCREASAGGEVHGVVAWISRMEGMLEEAPACADEAASDELMEVPRRGGAEVVNAASAGPAAASKSLKVDHLKIDRLMNLIGELVVSKNAMPYLAQKAENQFGIRELSREIKAQYSEINRIAEEMQDAIMQIRMMPVSVIFQRFPRLVRDISRRLGKEVSLVLEGEHTEADKTIIEALADPLIHIVRNSLDHGLETPEVRRLAGKAATGTLTIRAGQEADRVVIEIVDDGKGIDPVVIKKKALEKGLINPEQAERMNDREAIQLIFAAGFSTADAISDLSGRGVGMDVVRAAVEKVDGSLELHSEVGRGTRLTISLPLSMAVTQVIIVESDRQIFGIPMDHVVETVRVPRAGIRTIKQFSATMLRGRLVPLKSLNWMLGIAREPLTNSEDEYAVLVVRFGAEVLGVIVDEFRETVDIIQKPLAGVLSGLGVYSGSALMGDGSVLMVLNLREVL
jgi:two-component system chemotaxis sensor kinase CheA